MCIYVVNILLSYLYSILSYLSQLRNGKVVFGGDTVVGMS